MKVNLYNGCLLVRFANTGYLAMNKDLHRSIKIMLFLCFIVTDTFF